MYITYGDYKKLGYTLIPKAEFSRYAAMASKSIKRFISGKSKNIKDIKDIKNSKDSINTFSKDNKRGLCEIAELYYGEKNPANRRLAGFSNDTYREQYFEGARLSLREQIWEIMSMYFTQEQLYRGI